MKRGLLYVFLVFTLLSCGGSPGHFRLKGEFTHLQQGEFYLYSPDGGLDRIDTIRLEGGSFDYTTPLADQATYILLYPNYSEHVIFGRSGDVITVKGDARNLKSTRIEGNDENEKMTQFRLDFQDRPLAERRQAAATFIRQEPNSRVSNWLFKLYFLRADGTDVVRQRQELFRLLCQAQPDNGQLALWHTEVKSRGRIAVGQPFPDWTLTLADGKEVSPADYKGQYLLITFWAGWQHKSTSLLHQVRYWRQKSHGQLAAISYSLDVNRSLYASFLSRDTVDWPSYCDFSAWRNPQIDELGIYDIPYSILVGPDQKVMAHSGDFTKDILPTLKNALHLK